MTQSKPKQRILKTRSFTDVRTIAKNRPVGVMIVAGAAKPFGVVPAQSRGLPEKRHRFIQKLTFIVKPVKQTSRECAPALVNQQVTVAGTRQTLADGCVTAVGHVGVKDITDRDHVGAVRAFSDRPAIREVAPAVVELNRDAGMQRLIFQGLIQASRFAAAPQQIEKGTFCAEPVVATVGGKADDFADRRVIEAGLNAQAFEFGQHIGVRGPVFQPLEITMKAHPGIRALFVDHHLGTARPGGQCRAQAGRTGANDFKH